MTAIRADSQSKQNMGAGCLILFFSIFLIIGIAVGISMLNGEQEVFPLILVPLIFMLVGAGGVYAGIRSWGKSAERLAAIGTSKNLLPFPLCSATPGKELAWNLSSRSPIAAGVGCLVIFALIWNGFIFNFAFQIISRGNSGMSLFMLLFLIPFFIVGLGLPVFALRMGMSAKHSAVLEADRELVCPGEHMRVQVSIQRPASYKNLSIWLVCQERITYSRGSSTYHDQFIVYETELHNTGPMDVTVSRPYIHSFDVIIPEDAISSFKSTHNEINWFIRVVGEVNRWPNFTNECFFRVASPQVIEEVKWQTKP